LLTGVTATLMELHGQLGGEYTGVTEISYSSYMLYKNNSKK